MNGTNPSHQERQARLDGQIAAMRRQPQSANPHPLGCSFSRAWARGYREIADVRP